MISGKNVAGTVTLQAEDIIKLAEDLEALARRLRDMGVAGFKGTSPRGPPTPPRVNNTEGMPLGLDISGIEWKRSNKQGGGEAGPSDGWAWAFAYTQDGGIRREAAQLVAALEQYGKVLVDGFEISFAGRDGKLLNRKKGADPLGR